jgi:hypothetical protein
VLAKMADPLTAVGLAGSIIQFVDFSSRLVSKSQAIHRSANGELVENEHLEQTTTDLLRLQATLQQGLHSRLSAKELTKDEQALHDLSKTCVEVGTKLLSKLQKLKAGGERRKWKSFRQALKSIWSKEEVDALSWRLKGLREEMDTRMIVHLRY